MARSSRARCIILLDGYDLAAYQVYSPYTNSLSGRPSQHRYPRRCRSTRSVSTSILLDTHPSLALHTHPRALLLHRQPNLLSREVAHSHWSHPVLPGHPAALQQERNLLSRHKPLHIARELLLHASQCLWQHDRWSNLRFPDPTRVLHWLPTCHGHPPWQYNVPIFP